MLHVHNLSQNGLNQQNIHPLVYWFLVLFTLFLKISLFQGAKIIITIIRIFTITPLFIFLYCFPILIVSTFVLFFKISHDVVLQFCLLSLFSPSLFISPLFFKFLHSHELASHLISAPIIFHYKSCGVIFQVIDNCYNRV